MSDNSEKLDLRRSSVLPLRIKWLHVSSLVSLVVFMRLSFSSRSCCGLWKQLLHDAGRDQKGTVGIVAVST